MCMIDYNRWHLYFGWTPGREFEIAFRREVPDLVLEDQKRRYLIRMITAKENFLKIPAEHTREKRPLIFYFTKKDDGPPNSCTKQRSIIYVFDRYEYL